MAARQVFSKRAAHVPERDGVCAKGDQQPAGGFACRGSEAPNYLVFPLDSDHFSTRTKPVTLHCDARKLYLPADPQSGTATEMATAMETAMATAIPMAMRNRCRLPMLIRWKIRTT